ncbi:hypothetical protein CAPTEDRAFT_224738 [Capitella teleta]|uniref:SUEL-type lectin domain-containing protein n=1 Tax=Capitella teleta TaxID=283909 RepID=R7UNR1_CAPTE|nr:hypothetical protein CAPTEDRAFT_224738 [Capitella teleta]|eukprot:ELU07865.1 hypothetical protein CAPTEDRAFT_224738 [Capitella teleta]
MQSCLSLNSDYSLWKQIIGKVPVAHALGNEYKYSPVTSGEFCDYETFSATCQVDETVMITEARYGHMARGECITLDLGVFGCQADVAVVLQEKCDGQRTCSLAVNDEVLRNTQPCAKGITVYLEVTYACVKAVPANQLCNHIIATPATSYISSAQAKSRKCTSSTGAFDQEFSISAKLGQHVAVDVIEIAPGSSSSRELGYFLDPKSQRVHPIIVSGKQTDSAKEESEGNLINVVLSSRGATNYLVGFRAVGCADLHLEADVWVRRQGAVATVGCHSSRQIWQLRCTNGHWTGVIGNCSQPIHPQPMRDIQSEPELPLPRDIIFVIIGCCTFFIAILVVTAGYVCVRWPKRQCTADAVAYPTLRPRDLYYLPTQYSQPDSPITPDSEYQPIWAKPLPSLPDNVETLPRPKRNNEGTRLCFAYTLYQNAYKQAQQPELLQGVQIHYMPGQGYPLINRHRTMQQSQQ